MTLPSAVHALLVRARAGLKSADRSQTIPVAFGWPEVQGIYAMHTSLTKARLARTQAQKETRDAERALASARADIHDLHLLNDKAVLGLLSDVMRVLDGTEDSPRALFDTRARVAALLKRSKKRRRYAS